MSFNNGLYIFSEVPGYDASKGEPGIVKAFRKLQTKIECLEQVRISEKNTRTQNVQTNNDPDLTITDVKYEILLTQIRYIIKIVREHANEKQSSSEACKVPSAKTQKTVLQPLSNNSEFKPSAIDHVQSNPDGCSQTDTSVTSEIENRRIEDQPKSINKATTSVQTSSRRNNAADSDARLPHRQPKLHSQPHYHLKLDDVPFILGASSSASHSVVANIQNIIALMKSHNKALCAPKLKSRGRTSGGSQVNKADAADSNEMMRKLSEDLSNLKERHERLKEKFDNPQANHCEETKSEIALRNEKSVKSKVKGTISNNPYDAEKGVCSAVDLKNPSIKKKRKVFEPSQKHSIPTIRIQSNNDPQLARRKMLRSLKDFKTHLSEEDISWE